MELEVVLRAGKVEKTEPVNMLLVLRRERHLRYQYESTRCLIPTRTLWTVDLT